MLLLLDIFKNLVVQLDSMQKQRVYIEKWKVKKKNLLEIFKIKIVLLEIKSFI